MAGANESRKFTVGGRTVELSTTEVRKKLRGTHPEPIVKHSVSVNNQWYPVKQALELVTGIPRADSITTEARRVFRALGFALRP